MIPMNSNDNNDETIKSIADMLQMQGDEDMALMLEGAWARVKHELERVKGIAARRLDKINALQLELAQIEDDPRRLEDSEDDEIDASLARIRELDELGREPRSHLENEIADLRASAFRSADAAQYIVNYCR